MPYLSYARSACVPLLLACALTGCNEDYDAPDLQAQPAQAQNQLEPSAPELPTKTINPEPTVDAEPYVSLIAQAAAADSTGTNLVWNAENVSSCEASGAWLGSRDVQGNDQIAHIKGGEHTFALTCNGDHGIAMAMVTVSVHSTPVVWAAPMTNTNGSELTDLAGYNLYYGTEPGAYNQVLPVRDAQQTNLALMLDPGTYYMAMTAYDLEGNESLFSNEVRKVVN